MLKLYINSVKTEFPDYMCLFYFSFNTETLKKETLKLYQSNVLLYVCNERLKNSQFVYVYRILIYMLTTKKGSNKLFGHARLSSG